ncbi:ribokinase, partial [Microbispora rosea]
MISVFGSANMDLVAYVAQAPKPGETITGREFRTIPGGKGANQAIAAARAGADVAFLGAVGDDAFGPGLRAALAEAGVDTAGLRVVPGPSGVAHIVVQDGGDNSIIVVPGANGAVTGPAGRDAEVIARSGALLLQLELPMDAVVAAARTSRAAASRAEVILTPAPAAPLPAELLEAVDLIVPNEHEAAALTGRDDPGDALEALLDLVPEAVVTLGVRGALYGSRDGTRLHEPAVPVRAVDTTAAGDTFAGALAVARTEGAAPARALRFASA